MSSVQWVNTAANMSRIRSNSPSTMKEPTVMRIPRASVDGFQFIRPTRQNTMFTVTIRVTIIGANNVQFITELE